MIYVYGASDDLIEVEGGKLREEFSHYSTRPAWLEFSDGTILSAQYNQEGCWEIRPEVCGPAYYSHTPYTDPDGNYSDQVTLKEPLDWVKLHQVRP